MLVVMSCLSDLPQNGLNKLCFHKKVLPKDSENTDSGVPSNIQTFQESSRLIFFVSKFFGYSLFKLPKINLKNHRISHQFEIKTTFIDIAILVTMIVVYAYLIYYNLVSRFEINHSESLILMVGGQICLIIGLVVSMAAILLCYVRRKNVFKIFINLCSIDLMLDTFYKTLVLVPLNKRSGTKLRNGDTADKLPIILDHRKHYKFSVVFLLLGLISIGFNLAATYTIIEIEFNENPLVYISYALQNSSFFIITMQTVFFLLVIKTRFGALNKLICHYLKIQDDSNNPEVVELYDLELFAHNQMEYISVNSNFLHGNFRFEKKMIAEFAKLHDKLNDIVEWINGCYAVQCLGVVAVSFGYVILIFFSLYHALYHPYDKASSQLAGVYVIWFSFYAVCVFSLIIVSSGATMAGNKTGVLLHKSINQIMIDPRSYDLHYNEIIDSLRIFSLQLQKRSPIVSCGLFTYDWTLLFGIISASATYLIILIQFDSSMASLISIGNSSSLAII